MADFTQAQLTAAFEQALENKKSLFSGTGSTTSTTTTTTGVGDRLTPPTPTEGSIFTWNNFVSLLGEGGVKVKAWGEGLKKFVDEQKISADAAVAANRKTLDYLWAAKKSIGGISTVVEAGEKRAVGLANDLLVGYRSIAIAAADASKSQIKFADGTMKGLSPMTAFFSSARDAALTYDQIFSSIANTTPRAARALAEAGQATQESVTFFKRTLGLSETVTADILKRQYAFHGEVSEDVLGQIANTSIALMRQTGLGAQSLKKDIVEIITDVDLFGDIGVDAAGRISAGLGQLGLDFSTFKRMTQDFLNFDSAASKMGELSALFGIQMDAMEMTYLANEDQEEFLFRMREEILDSGVDIENMSKTRARALADQLGMNVMQMKTFLKEGELEFDQDAMTGATDAAEQMDALTTAGKYFGDETMRAVEGSVDYLDNMLLPSLFANENAIMRATAEANALSSAFYNVKFPDETKKEIDKLINLKYESDAAISTGKRLVAEKTIEGINSELADTAASTLLSGLNKGIDVLAEKIQKEFNKLDLPEEIKTEMSTYLRLISERDQVDSAGLRGGLDYDANFTRKLSQLMIQNQTEYNNLINKIQSDTLQQLQAAGGQMQRVADLLETGQPVNIVLSLDGRTIAESQQVFYRGKGQTIVINNSPGS